MRSLISVSIVAGLLCAMPYAAQAADDTFADCTAGQVLLESTDHHTCYGNGDKAPEQYKRKTSALSAAALKAGGLPSAAEDEQWVKAEKFYILVNIPNGVIKEIRSLNGRVIAQ